MSAPILFADGFTWPESPRWHNGALYLSDCYNFRVMRIAPGQAPAAVANIPGRPAGLGFMPDGRLLVGSALDRKLWWVAADGGVELALDLSENTTGNLNDLIVDAGGVVWVGVTGYSIESGEPEKPGCLYRWVPGEPPVIAAKDLRFPNGLALTPDGRTLYLCETMAAQITAFDVEPDGRLSNRRIHAALPNGPDGLCLDEEGALWVAILFDRRYMRIGANGGVLESIQFESELAVACVMGGDERRTLYLAACRHDFGDPKSSPFGSIYMVQRSVAGAGAP